MVYLKPYLEIKGNHHLKKDHFSNKRGRFSLFRAFSEQKKTLSLRFKRAAPKNGDTR